MTRVAILGAGLAGLTLARELGPVSDVTLFEKSRGLGGRLATRRAGPWQFDHGAQFFTAKTDAFRRFLEPLVTAGVLAPWAARFAELEQGDEPAIRRWGPAVPHYVGVPRMSRIGRHLGEGLDVRLRTRVARLERGASAWDLFDPDGRSLGEFEWVVATAPATQSAALLPDDFAGRETLDGARMLGCFALMLGFGAKLDLPFDAGLVKNADLSWISVDASKPGRPAAGTLIALASNAWAEAHMEDDLDDVQSRLQATLAALLPIDLPRPEHASVHRWRYANIPPQTGPRSLLDPAQRIAACGDWCLYGRVEGAFLSAMDLASRLRPLL